MMPRIGSLCTGYGGLDDAVRRVFGGELAWASDIDPGACQIIAHRMPGVPNLSDLRFVHWARALREYGPVNVVCGGYPCQPFSLAGDLKGTADARHIWPFIAGALRVLRPRYAIFENVANHLRLGFDTVLADFADLGFDVEWCVVRADEIGAPHQRRRLIFLATAADAPHLGHERGREARRRGHGPADGDIAATDAKSVGWREGRPEPAGKQRRLGASLSGGAAAADTDRGRLTRHQERDLGPDGPRQQASSGDDARGSGVQRGTTADTNSCRRPPHEPDVQQGQPDAAWGRFLPAIRRWERILGRPAPQATDDRNRLNPAFVEWMQGLPAGHVTDVPGLSRAQQLRALGNGVVSLQAEAAIRLLLARSREARAAA